jgi:alkylhydroperoxidase family enzyme
MPRFPYRTAEDLPADKRAVFRPGSNLSRALTHSPDGAKNMDALALYIRHDSPLDARLRELAITQIGYVAKSPYEYAHHVELALAAGCTKAEIHAIADETAGRKTTFGELERTVLKAAREMEQQLGVSDATFAVLKKHFEDKLLIELLIAMGTYCGVVRLLGGLQLDVEERCLPFLEEFPLPK